MSSRAAPIHGLDPEEKVEATLVWDGRSSPDFERDVCLEDLIHDFPISIPYPRALWAPAHRALPHLPGLLRRAAIFLLPSFIQPLVSRSKSGPFPSSSSSQHGRCLGPTAYLDGIRGLSAVAVFFYPPLLLPFVRLAFSGPPMVCVFFVVSGYALVLALAPLRRVPGVVDLVICGHGVGGDGRREECPRRHGSRRRRRRILPGLGVDKSVELPGPLVDETMHAQARDVHR
ncbi:hypothetical protein L209DRAFT_775898 [Thermothelomyces heterothallicus CBS 203.75]